LKSFKKARNEEEKLLSNFKLNLLSGYEDQAKEQANLSACNNITPMSDFRNHLRGFFDFYAKFHYNNSIISAYHGRPLPRIEGCDKPIVIIGSLNDTNAGYYIKKSTLELFVTIARLSSQIN